MKCRSREYAQLNCYSTGRFFFLHFELPHRVVDLDSLEEREKKQQEHVCHKLL